MPWGGGGTCSLHSNKLYTQDQDTLIEQSASQVLHRIVIVCNIIKSPPLSMKTCIYSTDPWACATIYTSTQKNLEFSTRVGIIAHQ